MSEVSAEGKALAAQGATTENLDAGSTNAGAPKAPPAPSNEKPSKEELNETHGNDDPAAKAAADKAIADKAVADKATAEAAERAAEEAKGPLKEFVTLDNPAAQAAINLLKESGLGPNEANKYFAKALKTGDLNDIDVDGLTARIGADKATLVMTGVKAHYNDLASQAAETVKQTHTIFGGEKNWASVRDWAHAAEKADPALKKQIDDVRDMLDQGGNQAAAGARELLRLYNAAPNNKGLGVTKLVQGDSTGTVIGTALNRADYIKELKAANERGAKPAEIKAIDARRRAGRVAGI